MGRGLFLITDTKTKDMNCRDIVVQDNIHLNIHIEREVLSFVRNTRILYYVTDKIYTNLLSLDNSSPIYGNKKE